MLVDFQPKAMPGAVEEADPSAFANFSRKTVFREKFLDCRVNRHPVDPCLDSLQSERLASFHRLPKLTLRIAGPSAQNRSGHVTKIPCLRISRKNIEDNQRIGVKRTVTPLMRVTGLVATRDNRPRRNAASAQDRRINLGPEDFGSQRFDVPAQSFSIDLLGVFQNFDGAFESALRNSQLSAHHFDFLFRFCLTLRPEKSVGRADTDLVCGEFLRVAECKICRDNYRSYAPFLYEMCENLFIRRRAFGFSLHFALELAEHDDVIRVGLPWTGIDFQIAQDKRAPAIAFQKDEWIGRPKLRRVKHVGIGVAGGNDEARWFCF